MAIVIRVWNLEGMRVLHYPKFDIPRYDNTGDYIEEYLPEAFDGNGYVTFTNNIANAVKFATTADAIAYARKVPANNPTRADGKPNRPLTAFTLEFVEVSL